MIFSRMTRLQLAALTVCAVVLYPGFAGFQSAHADPNVDASKDDALTNDVDGDTLADPGDTITYTIIITNSGNMDANGVSFSDAIDGNSTLAAGSVKTTPLAVDDIYFAIGNVGVTVPSGGGVLANDVDPDGGSVSAIPIVGGTSTNGGDVDLAADGSFAYDPPPAYEGTDTFTYTMQDADSNTDSATVTIIVSGMIWFVDASATCPCDGRLTNPFDDVAVTVDSFDVNAADAAGDTIFVAAGSYTGGLTLLNNQKLIGDGSSSDLATVPGITLPPNSSALPTFSGTDPVLTSSGDNLTVGQDNVIRGLTIGNSGGTGIRGTAVGTLTVSEASISGTGGAMDINSGNLAVSLDALSASSSADKGIRLASVTGTFSVTDTSGTISVNNFAAVDITGTGGGVLVTATFAGVASTNSATRGIRLANLTSGSSFNAGATTITASTVDGIVLSNNAGSNFTFADLDIDNFSTNQRGLFASTSGTINISDGDIDGGSGRGVDIDGTNLNVTLASVTSVGGSTAGIDLNTTTGTFEVTGDGVNTSVGGNASGGTISGKTGSDGTNNGIGVLLNNAAGVTLRRMQLNDFHNFAVRGTSVTGFALNNCTVNGTNGTSAAADEGSISFANLLGSADIFDSVIGGGLEDNVRIVNSNGTLNRLTVDNTTINANSTSLGNDGILVIAGSSATLNVTVTNSTFTAARGDQFQSVANGSASMDIVFTDNTLTNSHTNIVSGGGGTTFSGGGSTTVTYDISRNTMEDALGHALNVFMGTGGTANWSGTIDDNDIGDATVSGSGSEQAHGINVEAQGFGTHTTAITNNTVVEFGDRGIALFAIDGSARLNATVSDNTISQPFGSFPQEAIYAQAGAASGDTNILCADIFDNSLVNASGTFNDDFRLRQRKSTTFRLPGYAGSASDTAAVVSFVQANNSGTPSGSATVEIPPGNGFVGTSCASPLVASGGEGAGRENVKVLTQDALDEVVAEAKRQWSATGLFDGESARLSRVRFEITDLPDGQLGGSTILAVTIDQNGAGYGWSTNADVASDRMDLLTVVMHELGHVLGRSHAESQGVMAETLSTGARRVPPARKAEPETDADRTKRASDKVNRVDRAKDSRVLAAPSLRGLPIATSIMAAALTSTRSGETVNLTIGTLPPGKSITITFEVTVDNPLSGGATEICNQGLVSGDNFPDELTDDPDVVGVDNPTCTPLDQTSADLSITKDDSADPVMAGDPLVYTITVANNGPSDAPNVVVTDVLPAGVTFNSTTGCAEDPNGVPTCSLGTIPAGGTASYTIDVLVDSATLGIITNTASVSSDVVDPDPDDNTVGEDTTVNPRQGACCDGPSCTVDTEADCNALGGVYQGDDTTCDPSPCICGDLDDDEDVDGQDFQMFLAAFGRSLGDGSGMFNPAADFDNDDMITFVDYQAWLQCYRAFVNQPAASPPPLDLRGDYDADSDVDLVDYRFFWDCMAGSDPGLALPCGLHFDVDGDGTIGLKDFATFQRTFGTPVQ